MQVIPPIEITPSMITYSSIPEPDYAGASESEWYSGVSYNIGDIVAYPPTHRKYKCVLATSGTTTPDLDTTHWLDNGPTNKWAMFDLYRTTPTVVTSTFRVDISLGLNSPDSIAITSIDMTNIRIQLVYGEESIVYDSGVITLETRTVADYYDFFYAPFNAYSRNVLKLDLPIYTNAILRITSTNSTGSIGNIIIGNKRYIGKTLRSSNNEALNFSVIDRDLFGNSIINIRRNIPKTNQSISIKKSNVPYVMQIREDLNAVPAVWFGLDNQTEGYFDAMLVFGIYKTFSLTLNNNFYVDCTLELEEL